MYHSWCEVGGYFDGDGSTDLKIGKWVVFARLTFTENYRPQLEALQQFLIRRRIQTETINRQLGGALRLGIGQFESVRKMVLRMILHTFKKREELKAILDYFDNRITGTQFVGVMNRSVREGNRTGKIRPVDIPFTREEGQTLRKLENGEHARNMGKQNARLSEHDRQEMKHLYCLGDVTFEELAKKYGVGLSTISRTIFGRRERR